MLLLFIMSCWYSWQTKAQLPIKVKMCGNSSKVLLWQSLSSLVAEVTGQSVSKPAAHSKTLLNNGFG